MSSGDDVKRGRDGRRMNPRSLANLRPNPDKLVPGAGAWRPGDSPALKHGGRSRKPQRSPEWSPAVTAAIADLERCVGGLDRVAGLSDGLLSRPWRSLSEFVAGGLELLAWPLGEASIVKRRERRL